ncbi:TPA: hypothetical protein PNM72_002806 [Listeria monocytogenes]|uniref:Uncharacterized protein n=3 Tax=Listeria monocytogenes TaxID=1639 RepID=A0A142EC85_LISMN|nr:MULTISPECIES: hypothetical protein [Listeria]EAE3703856.1 hypothetical protein [Listeria monocytogenes serotype 1/2c]EAE3752992.1 hypothetical protein [Listeria monocytogenes serotype 1/2a]EAG6257387.1 hypothetical protein [Listeria monocytogenes CFSAN003807]EAG6275631.1 hypothetical protein [Listeria monocytogenes CFSAN003808]EAG6281843.1 hypothetical protein [Listeria monocytogenes CFSAN003809]EAH4397718.1 hypothetical protein [Listeria monocytogenes serotype 3a]CDM15161.1 conserved pro
MSEEEGVMRVKLSRKAYRKAVKEKKVRVPYNRQVQDRWKDAKWVELICKEEGTITKWLVGHYETMPHFVMLELK